MILSSSLMSFISWSQMLLHPPLKDHFVLTLIIFLCVGLLLFKRNSLSQLLLLLHTDAKSQFLFKKFNFDEIYFNIEFEFSRQKWIIENLIFWTKIEILPQCATTLGLKRRTFLCSSLSLLWLEKEMGLATTVILAKALFML